MGRKKNLVPTYLHHKPSGQAYTRIGGKPIYLGRFNSPESREAYLELIARLPASPAQPQLLRTIENASINDLVSRFRAHAVVYYRRPDGTHTTEVGEFGAASKIGRRLYGDMAAAEFGPAALQSVRDAMIEMGWCRSRVNKQIGRVKRIFKWGVSQEMVPPSTFGGLACVAGLKAGRSLAREMPRILPVADADVAAVIPHLVPSVRAMVELQQVTGMRPGEVRLLTPEDLRQGEHGWEYRPAHHKTEHMGKERCAPLGERAMAILCPYLDRCKPGMHLFTPAMARAEMYAGRRAKRVSKVTPSQVNRKRPAETLQKQSRDRWTSHGYAATIRRACERAGVAPWKPNQIRHAFATKIRKAYGLEAAQVLLGHSRADVTQIYAERDSALAARVMREIG